MPLEFYLTSVPPSCNGPPTILDESNLLVARIDEESILDFFNAESIERAPGSLAQCTLFPVIVGTVRDLPVEMKH
ncbi:hypothetical protein QCA50_018869 [Cerrena zonata]|uniref:Uncharacterized protein n=1 Tax=Cerrena zonata TaxID=2478898 RepID=A0AAW0FNF6_9APHY